MDRDVAFTVAIKVVEIIIRDCDTKEEQTAALEMAKRILDLRETT
jgi:hypothetical protein